MPRPAYPPDWAGTVRGLQHGVKAAYTAAQTRVRYAAIRAASIIIGQDAGGRITIGPDDRGRAAITLDTPTGASGRLAVSDGAEGPATSLVSTAPGGVGRAALLSLYPEIGGVWIKDDTGTNVTTMQLRPGGAYVGWMADGPGLRITQDRAYLDVLGEGARGQVRADRTLAALTAFQAGGAAVAGIAVTTAGTIQWTGSWSPAPRAAARVAAPVDPGPTAPAADQVAYLRRVVTDQAAEVAALRRVVDDMPRFERVSPETFADLVADDTDGEGVNT